MMLREPKRSELSCSDVPHRPRHGLNHHPRQDLRPHHELNRSACRALLRHRRELSLGLLHLRITRAPGQRGEGDELRSLFLTTRTGSPCSPSACTGNSCWAVMPISLRLLLGTLRNACNRNSIILDKAAVNRQKRAEPVTDTTI